MNQLKSALYALVALFLLATLIGFLLPSHWRVERSVVVQAERPILYPLLSDFRNGWPQWSAFDSEDPAIRYDFSGAATGAGAIRSWKSRRMGDGTQRILKANPATGIEYELVMNGGFRMLGTIRLLPMDSGTQVTWSDTGDVGLNPWYRYLALAMNRIMGPVFEKSLAKLKDLAESAPR
jgi:hypothetical protein